MSNYFSDRELGPWARTEQTMSPAVCVKSSNPATDAQTTKSLQINGLAHPRQMEGRIQK